MHDNTGNRTVVALTKDASYSGQPGDSYALLCKIDTGVGAMSSVAARIAPTVKDATVKMQGALRDVDAEYVDLKPLDDAATPAEVSSAEMALTKDTVYHRFLVPTDTTGVGGAIKTSYRYYRLMGKNTTGGQASTVDAALFAK